MTTKELIGIALKIIAIWFFLNILVGVPFVVTYVVYPTPNVGTAVTTSIICVIISFLALHFLWKTVMSFIKKIEKTESGMVNMHMTAYTLEKILMRCLGLYLMVTSIKPIISGLLDIRNLSGQFNANLREPYTCLAVNIIILCFGLGLIIKPHVWIKKIKSIRRS